MLVHKGLVCTNQICLSGRKLRILSTLLNLSNVPFLILPENQVSSKLRLVGLQLNFVWILYPVRSRCIGTTEYLLWSNALATQSGWLLSTPVQYSVLRTKSSGHSVLCMYRTVHTYCHHSGNLHPSNYHLSIY